MISLFLSVCVLGQPCKDERIADFYTALATNMCETNKNGMQESADAEQRKGTFVCRTETKTSTVTMTARLDFRLCKSGQCEITKLADFYGSVGQPLCGRNSEHYAPLLIESADGTHAKVRVECSKPDANQANVSL